jgi:8-oxo-dGTP diphosphatase
MKTIEVVAAMIQVEDMILVVQRKEDEKAYKSLKWEFPGGKVEEGERPEDAVVREVKEELQLDIQPVEALGRVVYSYSDVNVDLTLFHCALVDGLPIMKEHNDLTWSHKSLLHTVSFQTMKYILPWGLIFSRVLFAPLVIYLAMLPECVGGSGSGCDHLVRAYWGYS